MRDALDRQQLETALAALGDLLAQRGLGYEVVLVGGGNLLLRGVISRPTKDADLVGQRLEDGRIVQMHAMPAPLAQAVEDVARAYGLARDWLNIGPESLLELGLPDGFAGRLSHRDFGSLKVWFAGMFDLACFKLYAAADHWPSKDRHLADLLALKPTRLELLAAARWARTHDSSPDFRSLLVNVLRDVGVGDADVELG